MQSEKLIVEAYKTMITVLRSVFGTRVRGQEASSDCLVMQRRWICPFCCRPNIFKGFSILGSSADGVQDCGALMGTLTVYKDCW